MASKQEMYLFQIWRVDTDHELIDLRVSELDDPRKEGGLTLPYKAFGKFATSLTLGETGKLTIASSETGKEYLIELDESDEDVLFEQLISGEVESTYPEHLKRVVDHFPDDDMQ